MMSEQKTLYGDGSGTVIDLGLIVSESNRCDYEDEHGQCKNDRDDGHMFCVWHLELMLLRLRVPNE